MTPSKSYALMLLLAALILNGCDTTLNIKSPAKNYFLKYFGNEGSQTGVDFVVNSDGTIILFGTTQLQGGDSRFYLVKADASGNVIWERSFGSKCQARDVELASDGRIVVLGNMVYPGRTDFDIFIMTLSQDNTTLDSVGLYGYTDRNTTDKANEDASAVTETNDGFIIAGSSDNLKHNPTAGFLRDALVIRLNDDLTQYPAPFGDSVAYGQGHENVATKIVQLPNLNFVIFGSSTYPSNTNFDFWYFGLSQNGVPNNSVYFASPNSDEKLGSVVPYGTGYFLGGVSTDKSTQVDDAYIIDLREPLELNDTDFKNQTPKSLGFNLGKPVEHTAVFASPGSGYFILTNQFSTNSNLLLTKITSDAKIDWTTPVIYGGPGDDFAGSVQELPDGKILIFGTMAVGQASVNNGETKMVLMKVNKDGQFSD